MATSLGMGAIRAYPSVSPERMAAALDIRDDEQVLDIGGGGAPLPRADVVVDRDLAGGADRDGARACLDHRWLAGDIHALPFGDKRFDFAYCSHVLEHAHDPARACEELMRVAHRGYLETPRRITEMLHGHPTHRWLIDVIDGVLVFERRMFIESPLKNTMLAEALKHPEIFSSYLVEQRHLSCVQFTWSGRFEYRVIEPPNWQAGFDYDNVDHAGWSHFYFALNLLAQQAPVDYLHGHIERAMAFLPDEGLPVALACAAALLRGDLPRAQELCAGARRLECNDPCLLNYEQMLLRPAAAAPLSLPLQRPWPQTQAAQVAQVAQVAQLELEQLRSSRSWRLTAPLRRLAQILRGA